MSSTHLLSIRASYTSLLLFILLGTLLTREGARSEMHWPWSQRSDQKRVVEPSPTIEQTEAENKATTLGCTRISNSAQGLSGCVFLSQSHLKLSAQPRISRLWMPKPPRHKGLQTLVQLTTSVIKTTFKRQNNNQRLKPRFGVLNCKHSVPCILDH